MTAAGKPHTFLDLALRLAERPSFRVAVFTVAGAAYIWLERRVKLLHKAI
jgi:hypothetical protein